MSEENKRNEENEFGPHITVDCSTGEITMRALTAKEVAERRADIKKADAQEKAQEAKLNARAEAAQRLRAGRYESLEAMQADLALLLCQDDEEVRSE